MFSNLEWKYIFREEVTAQVQTSETKISKNAEEDPHDSINTIYRTQFTGTQLGALERAFKENTYPDLETR